MQCPTCNSDNVQKLQLIYEGGTQKINTTSTHSGLGYSARGGLMGGGGTTSTTGQSQSIAAKKATPPAKQSYKATILLIVAGVLLGFIASGLWLVIGILLLGTGLFFGYRANRYNAGPWRNLYDTWTRSWHCNKCGNVYSL